MATPVDDWALPRRRQHAPPLLGHGSSAACEPRESSVNSAGETNPENPRLWAHICRFARRTEHRVRTVEGYRLYRLDGVAKVASAEWIEADDDQAAIEVATKKMDGHGWELWDRTRLVIRREPKERR